MKRLLCALALAGALCVASLPDASAHERHYRGRIAYQRHAMPQRSHHSPAWLRRNYDFQLWYGRSRFRYDFYLSWYQLFDIYRYERRYRRPYPYRHYHHDHHFRH